MRLAIPTTASRTSRARTSAISSPPGPNGRAYGGWGDDFIYDGAGTEVLRGERGADHLIDDAGVFHPEDGLRDIFVLEVGLGMDTIQGFHPSAGAAGDRIWLQEGQFSSPTISTAAHLAAGQDPQPTNSPAATIAAHG